MTAMHSADTQTRYVNQLLSITNLSVTYAIDRFGQLNVVPNSNPSGIKRFVASIFMSFKCECYIIMQMKHTKNLNSERSELGTTLSWRSQSMNNVYYNPISAHKKISTAPSIVGTVMAIFRHGTPYLHDQNDCVFLVLGPVALFSWHP